MRIAVHGALALLPLAALLLGACQSLAPSAPPQAAPSVSVASLYQRPAERALLDGIRLYEDAAFGRAEQSLRNALHEGLTDPRDVAAAHKYVAFIACAFNRISDCEQSFRGAFAADPKFSLTDAEIGHPVWGPVYRRIAAAQPKG